jgi:SAM-dependent methyltransferase
MTIPDWQLPPGVDRGLWDYLHSGDMVRGYDEQMAESPLARADVSFCERAFPTPGRLVDLGCGTGRLAVHFAAQGFDCVGVDLSDEMLARAKENSAAAGVRVEWKKANLVDLSGLPDGSFDYAACLFSTLGMVQGAENRAKVVASAFRLLKPGGRFVLHIHNRYFRGLGWRQVFRNWWRGLIGRSDAGDMTMPQAYGGAPLTIHHFSFGEVWRLLRRTGFEQKAHYPLHLEDLEDGNRRFQPKPWFSRYGYLFLSERPR